MKKILPLLAFLLSSIALHSQDANFYFGKTDYELGTAKSKDEIWLSIQMWIAENTEFPQLATKMSDKDSGILIMKYDFPTFNTDLEFISFSPSATIRMSVSDSLCTIRITDAVCHVDKSQMVEMVMVDGSTYKRLTKAQNQIGWLRDLCVDEFGSSMDWNMLEDYIAIRDKYKDINEHTVRKKEVECNETKYQILQGALASYAVPISNLMGSLCSSISH